MWRYGKWIKLTPERLEKAESWFHKYGLWTVFFGYFVPGVRHFTCYLAGVSGVGFWRYLLFAGTGGLVWCTTFITLGLLLGSGVESVLLLIHHYLGRGLFILLLIVALGGLVYYRLRKRTSE